MNAYFSIGLGWCFGRQQKSVKEHFIGSVKLNPTLIGVSLFATLLSTITYLSLPRETIGKGPICLIYFIVYPLISLVLAYAILPVYMRQNIEK